MLPQHVGVEQLARHLEDPALRCFDATVHLVRPPAGGPYSVSSGRAEYEREHIPGAAFADIPGELSDPGASLPFTLPSAARFAAGAGRLGIGRGRHVVIYAQESPMWATRLWWQLRFFGFDAVSVLDGGLPAWRAAGLPTGAGPVRYEAQSFEARLREDRLARRSEVEALVRAGAPGTCLVNALCPEVFRGEAPSSYGRPGRVPGSVSVPWQTLLDGETNRFLPDAELVRVLEDAGALSAASPIVYCGGGISATVVLFALALAGRNAARLYDGSLAEWARDPALPIEVG